jgi:integrase
MPKPRAPKLESATARLKLPIAKKPIWVALAPNISLGYRRNAGAGTWSVRVRGNGAEWLKRIGLADDLEPAAPPAVLTFWQAQEEARKLARQQPGAPVDESRPVTAGEALDRYETYLKARGGRPYNAQQPRALLPAAMLDKPVQLLSRGELGRWRDSLVGDRQAATVNRLVKGLMASFALAAETDARVRAHLGELKIKALPAAARARNVVLTDDQVRAIVRAAYEHDPQLGLFVDVLAATGARPVQVARLTIADLLDVPPRLMMPRSAKGGSKDRLARLAEHVAVPVTASLARRLRAAAEGRATHAPLLVQRTSGLPWGHDPCSFYRPAVREVVAAVGLDPDRITLYALRHSAITRQLLAGTPIRIVAAVSDTSVVMIEKHYAKDIASHSDEIFRRGLLQDEAPADNVVSLKR